MLWAVSKGLTKGVLWKGSHCRRCKLLSDWHCSSFREQKAQRGQVDVCRRPRLSQTWGRSVDERLRLGLHSLAFSPSPQPSRVACQDVCVLRLFPSFSSCPLPPRALQDLTLTISSPLPCMVFLGNLHLSSGDTQIFIISSDLVPKFQILTA
jgi:hypothetical protein